VLLNDHNQVRHVLECLENNTHFLKKVSQQYYHDSCFDTALVKDRMLKEMPTLDLYFGGYSAGHRRANFARKRLQTSKSTAIEAMDHTRVAGGALPTLRLIHHENFVALGANIPELFQRAKRIRVKYKPTPGIRSKPRCDKQPRQLDLRCNEDFSSMKLDAS
jgi:hypothetical protein